MQDISTEVREALRGVAAHLPWVARLEYRTGIDCVKDEALWVWVVVTEYKYERTNDVLRDVRTAAWAAGWNHWVYVRVKLSADGPTGMGERPV